MTNTVSFLVNQTVLGIYIPYCKSFPDFHKNFLDIDATTLHLTRRGILVVLQNKQYVSPSLSPYPVLAPGPVHSALTHYQARPGQHIHFVGITMMIFSLSVHQSISRSRQNLTFEAEISSGKYRGNPSTTKIFEKVTFKTEIYSCKYHPTSITSS